jgi:hypothetical protein
MRTKTIATSHLQITVDSTGFAVTIRRVGIAADKWVGRNEWQWASVRRLAFDVDRHDPIVSLFVYKVGGGREHVMDTSRLSRQQWAELAAAIAKSTNGRIVLDLPAGNGHFPSLTDS